MAYIRSRKHGSTSLSATAAAVAALALPAHAQQAPAAPVLPEVKATGTASEGTFKADSMSSPKFMQPLVDTPQTITVIKKEILQQQGATTLTEALRNTPGITLQLGENGNTQTGDSIFMRGFDTSGSIFVDGIRDLGSVSRDTFNLEAVEVVKGPAGSDNGRGASSGYVNMVSKTALRERFTNASITGGTDSRFRATVDANMPLDIGFEGSALRLNFMAQDYGTPGRDEVKAKRWGFAPTVSFGLGTPTRTTLSYLHLDQKNRPDGGVSTFGLEGYVFPTGVSGPKVDSSNYYGSRDDFDNVKVDMFTAQIEHKLTPNAILRNTTRMGYTRQDLLVTGVNSVIATAGADASTFQLQRSRQGKQQDNEILTNQTNLSTVFETAGLKHALSTGFELIYERQSTDTPATLNNTTNPAQPPANLYNPSLNDAFVDPPYRGTYAKGSTLSAALYAFDTIDITDQFMVNGGIRFERYHTDTNSATYTLATNTLVQNAPLGVTDNLFSWKLSAVYKPAANGSVYGTVSNSYLPPGGSNFTLNNSSTNANFPGLDPQEGSNIEIGTKWDFLGGKLAFTGAIFRSENENELISDGATPPTFSQVGKRRVDGVELGVVGQVMPELDLSAGFAYMDSEIVKGTPAQQGGVIVYTPKITFTSWATYRFPFGLTVAGGARYVDSVARSSNLAAPTSNLLETPDYWVVDAMLAYEVTKNFQLQLNLYNLFDKEYIATINNGGSRYTPGAARNALLTANLFF